MTVTQRTVFGVFAKYVDGRRLQGFDKNVHGWTAIEKSLGGGKILHRDLARIEAESVLERIPEAARRFYEVAEHSWV